MHVEELLAAGPDVNVQQDNLLITSGDIVECICRNSLVQDDWPAAANVEVGHSCGTAPKPAHE
jgi:hypothetical protein